MWSLFGIPCMFSLSVKELLFGWHGRYVVKQYRQILRFAPLLLVWCIWREYNDRIFNKEEHSDQWLKKALPKILYVWPLISLGGLDLSFFWTNVLGGAFGLKANCSFLCFSSFLILWHFFVYFLCIWFMPRFNTSPHCLLRNILPPLPLPPLPSFVLLVPCVQEDLLSFSKWNEYQHVFPCTFPLASSCKFCCGCLIEFYFFDCWVH